MVVMAEQEQWVQVQIKSFTRWANAKLAVKGYKGISDPSEVDTSWTDGHLLARLINALYDLPVPRLNKNPRLRPQKIDNLVQALKMVDAAGVKTNFLQAENLADCNLVPILGMMWSIILHYAINGISIDDLKSKEGLLLWVQKQLKGYRDIDPPNVQNFHRDWKNGLAFCGLMHRFYPEKVDYDTLEKGNAAENLKLAFDTFQEVGIPVLLDVEDCLVDMPDDKAIMAQVAEIFHHCAKFSVKEDAARRLAKFAGFARRMKQSQEEYERRSQALKDFYSSKAAEFDSAVFEGSVNDVQDMYKNFRDFVVSEKPQQEGEKLDVASLYADIQTELSSRGRAAYQPPEGLSPTDVSKASLELAAAESQYSEKLQQFRFSFIEEVDSASLSPEQLAEVEQSFDHFDQDKSGFLDKIEFKAALNAIGVPFREGEEFDNLFAQVAQGDGRISRDEFINYLTTIKADREDAATLLESFKTLADQRSAIAAPQLRVPPMEDQDIEFLLSTMPEIEEGQFDYAKFVEEAFE
ncbi:MAG: hypothetical protein MHM6MM_004434 [Cercozoa sp. M6MM]